MQAVRTIEPEQVRGAKEQAVIAAITGDRDDSCPHCKCAECGALDGNVHRTDCPVILAGQSAAIQAAIDGLRFIEPEEMRATEPEPNPFYSK